MGQLRVALAEDDETLRELGTIGAAVLAKSVRPLDLVTAGRPKCRVLVATDHPDGLADRLAAGGYEVTDCPVAETPAAAAITRPHLILVDAPGGREAVRRVRDRGWGSAVRIIAVGEWEDVDHLAGVAGCDAHFDRPVGVDEVRCLLDNWDERG